MKLLLSYLEHRLDLGISEGTLASFLSLLLSSLSVQTIDCRACLFGPLTKLRILRIDLSKEANEIETIAQEQQRLLLFTFIPLSSVSSAK